MLRGVRQFIHILLTAVLMFGGAVTLADSVSHAAFNGGNATHDHMHVAQDTGVAESDVAAPDTGKEDPNHTAGHCLDAHCCSPDSLTTDQTVLKHPPAAGTLVARANSGYLFTGTYGLLRPPRATA